MSKLVIRVFHKKSLDKGYIGQIGKDMKILTAASPQNIIPFQNYLECKAFLLAHKFKKRGYDCTIKTMSDLLRDPDYPTRPLAAKSFYITSANNEKLCYDTKLGFVWKNCTSGYSIWQTRAQCNKILKDLKITEQVKINLLKQNIT